jgi:hypothetical protein
MPGKYTELRKVLPAFEEEPDYQKRIDEAKMAILGTDDAEGSNVARLAAIFAEAKREKEVLEECDSKNCGVCLYCVNVKITALSQLLVHALQDQSLEKVSLSRGGSVFLQDTPYPSVEEKDKLMSWIDENEMSAMLTLPWMTLKGICNERLQAGEEVPPGVKVFIKTEARYRR